MRSNRALTFRAIVLGLAGAVVLAGVVLGGAMWYRSRSPGHLAAKAQLAIEQRDPQRAIEFLSRAMATHPDEHTAKHIRALLAQAYLDAGREEDARAIVQENLTKHPGDERSTELLINTHVQPAYRALQQAIKPITPSAAKDVLQVIRKHQAELEKLSAGNGDARFGVARAELNRLYANVYQDQARRATEGGTTAEWSEDPAEQRQKAYQLLADARAKNPKLLQAWQLAAGYYYEDGDYVMAYRLYKEALAANVTSESLTITAANAIIADTPAIPDRNRRLDAGLRILQAYDKEHADRPRILVAIGQLTLERGTPEAVTQAAQLAHRALAKAGAANELDAQLLLVTCKLRENQPAEAIKQLSPLLSSHGAVPQVWHLLGLAQLQQNNYPQAIDAFRKVLALNPGFTQARRGWLTAEMRSGNSEAAARMAGPLLREDPYFMPAWAAQMEAEKRAGNTEAGVQRLQALSRDPRLPDDAKPELARLLAIYGPVNDAERVLSSYRGQVDMATLRVHAFIVASRLGPVDAAANFETYPPKALVAIASRWASLGQPQAALQLLEKSPALNDPAVKEIRAALYVQTGALDKAAALNTELAKAQPTLAGPKIALAQTKAAAGDYAGAMAVLNEAQAAGGAEATQARLARARFFVAMGLLQAAADELAAVKADAQEETATELLQVASTYAALQKRDQARATLALISKSAPEHERGILLEAQMLSDEKRHTDATNLLKPLTTSNPPKLQARALMVQIFLRAGKTQEALTLASATRDALIENSAPHMAWTVLAATAAREHRAYDKASALLSSLRASPENNAPAVDLALIRLLQKQPREAASLAVMQSDATPHYMRTTIQLLAGAENVTALKPDALRQANLSTILAHLAYLPSEQWQSWTASIAHVRLLPADLQMLTSDLAGWSRSDILQLALAQRLVESGWANAALDQHQAMPKTSSAQLLQKYQATTDLGRESDAKSAFDTLTKSYADMPIVRQLLARRLAETENFAQAIEVLKPLESSNRSDILTTIAQHHERLGQLDRAIAIHRQLRMQRPDDIATANNLAYTLALSSRGEKAILDEAKRHIEFAIAKSANPAVAAPLYDTLGYIQYLSGKHDEAVQSLGKSLPVLRLEPAMHYHLGLAYAKTRQPVLAKLHLSNVQHLAKDRKSLPEVPLANEALKQLAANQP